MKILLLSFYLILGCGYSQDIQQTTISYFDQGLIVKDILDKKKSSINSADIVKLCFGDSNYRTTGVKLSTMIDLIQSFKFWELTSVSNGFRMMGQTPEGIPIEKLCLYLGLDLDDDSDDEDLKIVIYVDIDTKFYGAYSGPEIMKEFLSKKNNPQILGYFVISDKTNGWFFDYRKEFPFPIVKTNK